MGNQFGFDKLNFWLPAGTFDIEPGKRSDSNIWIKQTTIKGEETTTKEFSNQYGLNVTINNEGAVIGTNPSRMTEPEHYVYPNTYLNLDLNQYSELLPARFEKIGLHVDSINDLKPFRVDIAAQGFLKNNYNLYVPTLSTLHGKNQRYKMQFNGTTFVNGSGKSNQFEFYNKSLQANLSIPNLLRGEMKLLKGEQVKKHLANTFEGLANLSERNIKIAFNKFVKDKTFHNIDNEQLKINFENVIQIGNKHGLNNLLKIEGVRNLALNLGGINNLLNLVSTISPDSSSRTIQRYKKEIKKLYIISNSLKQQDKIDSNAQILEIRKIIYQNIERLSA